MDIGALIALVVIVNIIGAVVSAVQKALKNDRPVPQPQPQAKQATATRPQPAQPGEEVAEPERAPAQPEVTYLAQELQPEDEFQNAEEGQEPPAVEKKQEMFPVREREISVPTVSAAKLREGLILAEILGRPRALRPYRPPWLS